MKISRGLFLRSVGAVVLALGIGCSNSGSGGGGVPFVPIKNEKPGTGRIVAFGDSLTSGLGSETPYSEFLKAKLGNDILNTAVPGWTSEQALAQIQQLVLQFNPKLVILTIGGNDGLKEPRLTPTQSLENLQKIISAAQAKGALVLFAGILPPIRQLLPDVAALPDDTLEAAYGLSRFAKMNALASQTGALVIDDLLAGIWLDPKLKKDTFHPNTEGNKIVADKILKAIEGHYP